MKMLWRAALGAALLAGCSATLPVNSSGSRNGAAPLVMLAIQASPQYSSDAGQEVGDTGIGNDAAVRRFARAFAFSFSTRFPPLVKAHGVTVVDADEEAPVLRVRIVGYQVQCRAACETQVHIVGVLGDAGAPSWSFDNWLNPEEMDQAGFQRFMDAVIAVMVKDQVIPAGLSKS